MARECPAPIGSVPYPENAPPEYLHQGAVRTVRADGEILLAAGAFVSPQILLPSGIGPAEQLRGLGIPIALDRPGVGGDLQDHVAASIDVETHGIEGYSGRHRGLRMLRNGAEYLLFGGGRAATWTRFSAAPPRPTTIRSAPAAWTPPTIATPWSAPTSRCMASPGCG